jgi:hypothetical protein
MGIQGNLKDSNYLVLGTSWNLGLVSSKYWEITNTHI